MTRLSNDDSDDRIELWCQEVLEILRSLNTRVEKIEYKLGLAAEIFSQREHESLLKQLGLNPTNE
jgi:hypothetical protein